MFRKLKSIYWPIIILVLVNLIIGWIVLPGFGESSDERSQKDYAERTIHAAVSIVTQGVMPLSFIQEKPMQGSHGPAFIVVVTLLGELFLKGRDSIDKLNFYHFLYFLMFQVGVVSLYFLARRWVSRTASFGVALLFNTQPILLGQAFMNPKDIIFMSLMTASAALGLWMIDRNGKSPVVNNRHPWSDLRSFFCAFLGADVWLAGMLLGFTSAIRMVAPIVGLVIFVYLLLTRKWQAFPRLLAYGLIAFSFMIVCWPYVWPDPVGRLLDSVINSTNYPGVHLTLFKGVLFKSEDIPLTYLPVLLALQLTGTTLLLSGTGAFSFLKKIRWDLMALVLIWFVLPVSAAIMGKFHLYNNLRQVFFILPPLFLLAGLGLDWLFMAIKRPAVRWLFVFLVVLPGLYANITLYPYQYIYYNPFVGGVQGAYRNYDLDYWNLAYKEAQEYINLRAIPNANIYIDKSKNLAQTFARDDISFNAFGDTDWNQYDYIIVSTSRNLDKKFAEFPTVYQVLRDGVPLAFVKVP